MSTDLPPPQWPPRPRLEPAMRHRDAWIFVSFCVTAGVAAVAILLQYV